MVRFDLQSSFSAGLGRLKQISDDLRAALGVNNSQVTEQSGRYQLKIPRPGVPAVSLIDLLHNTPNILKLSAFLGLTNGGKPLMLNFGPTHIQHVLIAGDQGAGKTALLRTMISGLAYLNRQSDLQMIIIDPIGDPDSPENLLRPLGYLPHLLTDPAFDPEHASEVLKFLVYEMDYRRKEHIQHPEIMVFIDHIVTLIDQNQLARQQLIRLLQHGPEAGIHLIMTTRRPESSLLDITFRTNLSMRLVGKLDQQRGARKVAGLNAENASSLYGIGDFLAIRNHGEEKYFQAAFVDDYDLHWLISNILNKTRPTLLAQTYNPRPRQPYQSKPISNESPVTFTVNNNQVWLDIDEGESPISFE